MGYFVTSYEPEDYEELPFDNYHHYLPTGEGKLLLSGLKHPPLQADLLAHEATVAEGQLFDPASSSEYQISAMGPTDTPSSVICTAAGDTLFVLPNLAAYTVPKTPYKLFDVYEDRLYVKMPPRPYSFPVGSPMQRRQEPAALSRLSVSEGVYFQPTFSSTNAVEFMRLKRQDK